MYDEKKNSIYDDVKYLQINKKDYVDLIYIFKHKGKYSTDIYANDGQRYGTHDMVAEYKFESLEEWGNKKFDFSFYNNDFTNKS